jgi:hypothetical protein
MKETLIKLKIGEIQTSDILNKIFLQNPEDELEKLLFRWYIEKKGDVVLMLDGYDRVPDHQEKIIQLLKQLKERNIKQVWVTTRTLKEARHLEEELEISVYVLPPFSQQQQIGCLVQYWQSLKKNAKEECGDLNVSESGEKKEATEIISRIEVFIGSLATEFTGIALHCRILAEIVKTDPAPKEHCIFKVCKELWDVKFNSCWSENFSGVLPSTFVELAESYAQDYAKRMHERRALEQLYGQEHKELWQALPSYDNQDWGLNTESKKLHPFVAAYFASQFLSDNIVEHITYFQLLFYLHNKYPNDIL